MGLLKSILIGHDGKGLGAGWHLARVVVEHLGRGQRAVFTVNQWFDAGEGDKKIERELYPDGGLVAAGATGESVVWSVMVVTGDVRGAGTDADVSIALRCGRREAYAQGYWGFAAVLHSVADGDNTCLSPVCQPLLAVVVHAAITVVVLLVACRVVFLLAKLD